MAYGSGYGAPVLPEIGPAGLRNAAELDGYARACLQARPDLVGIERSGFFSRGPVSRLVVRLGATAFIARIEGGFVVHEIGGLSLGVVVRTQPVHPGDWADRLRAHLQHHNTTPRST